ncbi:MAG: hypothetical protein ACM3ZQ_03155 [Bacillota bacterium]
MPLLIVDGIIATGKTTLIAQLQREPRYLERPTKLLISEHVTERVLEGRRPTTDNRLALLDKTLQSIENLSSILEDSKFAGSRQHAPAAILERFHLTHAANDTCFVPYLELEARMRLLGAYLVFLYHRPETLATAIDETRLSRGDHWCRYLDSFGGYQGAIAHFQHLQDRSWEFFLGSALPKVAIEARSLPIAALSSHIMDLWLGNADESGLNAPCDLTTRVET